MSAPGEEGRIPRPGPTDRGVGGKVLGRALESLFDARPGDDVVAVTEAEFRFQRPVLVPEALEALAQALELCSRCWVMSSGEDLTQLGPTLAGLLDLFVNFNQRHAHENALRPALIPGGRGKRTRARG